MSHAMQGIIRFAVLIAGLAAIAITMLITSQAGAATHPYYDNDPFIPSYIDVGPNSTQFQIVDESQGKPVRYYCAFLRPRDTHRNTGGEYPLEIYVPVVQCNKYAPDFVKGR